MINLDIDTVWQANLALYEKTGVSELLLTYQNQLAANVNLILLLHYLQQQQISLSVADISKLHHQVSQFNQQFTAPLRSFRAECKQQLNSAANYSQLRKALLEAELELERLELGCLIETSATCQPSSKVTDNLAQYQNHLQKNASFTGELPPLADLNQTIIHN